MSRRFVFLALSLLPIFAEPAIAESGAIDGILRDQRGKPLAATQVILQDGQGKTAASFATDAEGHFTFSTVAPGSYVVQAVEKQAVLGSVSVSVTGTELVHKDLTLQAEQAMTVVVGKRLESARNNLSPRTGTNAYKLDTQAITAMPQGADTSFDKILEQTPGVAEDSFGQVHVRGEHGDLQYRLNGILLPEGISGFGQVLDSRIIESSTLLDGALPAEYGYRTAGIVDIQTKSGFANAGEASFRGGSYGTLQPSIEYGGTFNSAEYFVTASHLSSDFGIEPSTGRHNPLHDHTEQNKQFGYGSYLIDPSQRVELIVGNAVSFFQIPNNPGQVPEFTDGANSSFESSRLNERQFESNQYATAAWQAQKGAFDIQVAPYIRSSETHFRPDVLGDLLFNGVASDVKRTDFATGVQADGSYKIDNQHTLRSGLALQQEHVVSDNTSTVFPGTTGIQSSFTPETVADNSQKYGQLYGIYLQDEWKITDNLTVNYGARFDVVNAFVNESQLSPRVGLLYRLNSSTSFHAGYARYFTPPPLELVSNASVALFNGTTNQANNAGDASVKAERTHSFDVGITHQLTDELKLGVDSYYKLSHDLIDEGQFGRALVFSPFNYEKGRVYGVEATASYQVKDFTAYGNLAVSRALGMNIVSAQFNFNPTELAYIQNHWVHLDHDQTYTASAGMDYKVIEGTELGLDGIFGSGLRQGFANTGHLPHYVTFDASVRQELNVFPNDKTALRLTVINLLDSSYELRSGSGIGVGAPQWGQRRGFFVALSQGF